MFERRNIIAKIVRVNPRDEVLLPDMLHELVLEGLLEPAKHHLPKDFFADMPRAKASVLDALIAEREEGL